MLRLGLARDLWREALDAECDPGGKWWQPNKHNIKTKKYINTQYILQILLWF